MDKWHNEVLLGLLIYSITCGYMDETRLLATPHKVLWAKSLEPFHF